MTFGDPFPRDMTAGDFVRLLDQMVRRPRITASDLASEQARLSIAQQEGQRELADKLVQWLDRKDPQ